MALVTALARDVAAEPVPTPDPAEPAAPRARRRRRRPPSAVAGAAVLGVLVATVLAARHIRPYGITQTAGVALEGISAEHWFGTDALGRDLFVRVFEGGKTSLLVASCSALLAALIGVPPGLLSAYYGGWLDRVFSAGFELLFAIPPIVVALGLIVVLEPSTTSLVLGLGVVFSPYFARVARGAALSLVGRSYVEAARIAGVRGPTIIRRHLLPHIVNVTAVQVTTTASVAILLETALSFIGLGVQPPTPSWGRMIFEGQRTMEQAPLVVLAPALVLVLTTTALSLLADGLQELTDTDDAIQP